MKVAVIGPVVKDIIKVDNDTHVQAGGIPFYIGNALHHLDVDVTVFATYSEKDHEWMKKYFPGIKLINIPVKETLEMRIVYSSKNPDDRTHTTNGVPNTVPLSVVDQLKDYDLIIFGPLFYDNIPHKIFEELSHKKLKLGNFGMFMYAEEEKMVYKNPENMIKILKHIKYLFLDEKEIMFAAGKDNVKDAVKELQKHVDNIIVTRGSKGSSIFTKNKEYRVPAYPPKKLEDPTGAGDTFLAGFVKATTLFDDPEKQGMFAAMVATISLERKGPFNSNVKEVYSRLGWKE